MNNCYIDEFPEYWKITAPKITAPQLRTKNATQKALIQQLEEYPLSFFETAYSLRPEFNSSLWGYFMAVSGKSVTVEVLTDPKIRKKQIKKGDELVEIEYKQKVFITQSDVRTVQNFVTNKIQVREGRKHRANGDTKAYKKAKSSSIVVSGSVVYQENTPNKQEQNIAHRNQLIFIDIDLDFDGDLVEVFSILKQDPYTKIAHHCFSGDGFVVVVEMSESDAKDNFLQVFKKIEKYYKENYNLTIDASCKNVGRLRYISYDPEIFIKENVLIEITPQELEIQKTKTKIVLEGVSDKIIDTKLFKTVGDLVDEIITTNNRLVDGFDNWLKIAFSMKEYPKEWDRLNEWRNDEPYYKALYKANRKPALGNIKVFYSFCKKAGIFIREKTTSKINIHASSYNENSVSGSVSILDEINKYEIKEAEELKGFLSDKLEELIENWSFSHINILVSPASSGKTSMVVKLKEKEYRCLLIVPTKAIIKNKKFKDFEQVYDNTSIKAHVKSTKSIICTFDKGAQLDPEDFAQFDYVFIDESHLLFTELYRMNPIVLLLKKIENFVLNEREEVNLSRNTSKIILMTGTLTGEEHFFQTDKKGEVIIKI